MPSSHLFACLGFRVFALDVECDCVVGAAAVTVSATVVSTLLPILGFMFLSLLFFLKARGKKMPNAETISATADVCKTTSWCDW